MEVAPRREDRVRFQEHDVQINGGNIHFLHAGDPLSPKVILLHGVMSSAALCYKEAIDPISKAGFEVFAPDLPGYGQSDAPTGHTTDHYISAVLEFMDEVGIERSHIAGLSFGGAVTMGTALRNPERVDSIALVNSWGFEEGLHIPVLDNNRVARFFTRLVKKEAVASHIFNLSILPQALHGLRHLMGERMEPALRSVGKRVVKRDDYFDERDAEMFKGDKSWETLWEWLKHEIGPDGPRTNFLPHLRETLSFNHPTLIIQGGRDPLISPHWGSKVHDAIAHSFHHVIEDSSHALPLEKPEEFAALVGNFFSERRTLAA